MLQIMLSMDNENNNLKPDIDPSAISSVQINDTSKFIYSFSPTWFQQGMKWPPNHQPNK